MAAKRTEKESENRAADQPGAVVLTPPAKPVLTIARAYRVGSWAGRENYECELCSYSTLNESAMIKHVTAHFRAPDPEAEQAKTHT